MTHEQVKSGQDASSAEPHIALVSEQIRLLTKNRVDLIVNLVNAALVSAVFWRLYPRWLVLLWLVFFSIVIRVRYLARNRYLCQVPALEETRSWGRIFTLNALATGCLWGITGSVILLTHDPLYQLFIVFVLGGMMAGGIVSNSAYMPALYAFALPTVLPVTVILVSRHNIVDVGMGVMLAIFTVVVVSSGSKINKSIIESFRLRMEKEISLAELQMVEAAMAEAQSIARVGSWEHNFRTNRYTWSAEMYRILGLDPDTSVPSYETMLSRVFPADRPLVEKAFANQIADGSSHGIDHRIVMADGTVRNMHVLIRVTCDANGNVERKNGTTQDVTEQRLVQEKLQFANILLTTEMEASPDGILVVDRNRKIVLNNREFGRIWKIPTTKITSGKDDLVLEAGMALVKDPEGFSKRVKHLYDHPEESAHDEFEMADGRFIDRHTLPLRTPSGDDLGRIWFFRDISVEKEAAAQAVRMARLDALTGLANRSVFVSEVEHAVMHAKRGEPGFAVIYLDLDHFKDVNDTLGHPVGDSLLRKVAERLQLNTRKTDTVSRFGGDEFAVLVGAITDPAAAALLANKLVQALNEPYLIEGNKIYSGASIGIDIYGTDASDAETLLSHADVALYRAKAGGRGGYRFFTDAMDTEVRMQVSLGTELHKALDAGELFLMYQPQVVISSGQMTGVEALARWRHPQRGILGPDIFIPIAEKTGMILKLGDWALRAACTQAKIWIDAGLTPIRVAVNLSVLQFKSPTALEDLILSVLTDTGFPPQYLELELTETVLMNVAREHREIVLHLRKLGVTIAIDDFGTGYSSLDYLRRFSADRLKIAQSFVRNLESAPGDVSIVKATIGLARELGITVIAEGVETREQLEMLKRWGCAEVQGYYFAKPLAAADIASILRGGGILHPGIIFATEDDKHSVKAE